MAPLRSFTAIATVSRSLKLLLALWPPWNFWAIVEARAATYIVDQTAPAAADTNPGTEAEPLKTVQRAAELLHPGDAVLIMQGTYPGRVTITASGTADRMLSFRAVPRQSVVLGGFTLQGSYIRVEGFELTADKPEVAVQLEGSHCEVLDNYIHDMSVAVAGTVGRPSSDRSTRDYSAVAHNRIAYNRVYHCQYGFLLGGNDWLVENNEVNRLFMYSPGSRFDDCDYSRFFGRGCIERYNYFHGSTSLEIRVAHVDCLQTFTVNGEVAQDVLFEYNTCFDFHQLCMVESAPHIGSVRNWTLRGNIVSANSPSMRGGWGPDVIQTPNVIVENNTISTVRWAAIGLRGSESTHGIIRNNILCDAERPVVDGDQDFTAARPLIGHNLAFKTSPLPGSDNINGEDPLFIDPAHRNFRLQKGSAAIGVGQGRLTIGALEYPNVYYVDPRHPAACDEPGWGYPAVPLKTLAKAGSLAQPGDTVTLRAGVYREPLAVVAEGVTVRAMPGEMVTISGADLIEHWTPGSDGEWSAPLKSRPKQILRDGEAYSRFSYNRKTKRILVNGSDPRLHLFETLVRQKPAELKGKNLKFEGIMITNFLQSL